MIFDKAYLIGPVKIVIVKMVAISQAVLTQGRNNENATQHATNSATASP